MTITQKQIEYADLNSIQIDATGLGFDYGVQAWIKDGRYVRCGHPDSMNCTCYGKRFEGKLVPLCAA